MNLVLEYAKKIRPEFHQCPVDFINGKVLWGKDKIWESESSYNVVGEFKVVILDRHTDNT